MTNTPEVPNERLDEIAAYQALDFAIEHSELVSMATELRQLRADHARSGEAVALREALQQIIDGPRDAAATYAELFADVISELRAALKGDSNG